MGALHYDIWGEKPEEWPLCLAKKLFKLCKRMNDWCAPNKMFEISNGAWYLIIISETKTTFVSGKINNCSVSISLLFSWKKKPSVNYWAFCAIVMEIKDMRILYSVFALPVENNNNNNQPSIRLSASFSWKEPISSVDFLAVLVYLFS